MLTGKQYDHSIDKEKAFFKYPTSDPDKNIQQTRNRRIILNLIKGHYKNCTTNVILNDERQNYFPTMRKQARMSTPTTSSQHCSEGFS